MQKINDLRLKINDLDQKLLDLIIKRIDLVREIGRLKKKNGMSIIDKTREKEVLNRLVVIAKHKGIQSEIVKKIWKGLIEISYEIEGEKNGNS